MNISGRVKSVAAALIAACLPLSAASAQERSSEADLPVRRIALFSSGVGYFEHGGRVSGDVSVPLAFRIEEVNDALKSLVVYAGAENGSPDLSYPSKEDFARALKAFGVDLSGAPTVAELLDRSRGAEVQLRTAGNAAIAGRILSVEARGPSLEGGAERVVVAVRASDGVRSVPLDEIDSFRFTDPALEADFERALSLIAQARDATRALLSLRLPGRTSREAVFGYVVAAPVWKATYRLDLSARVPFLQAWAVVDNATDRDWKSVELSLVSGRPSSFIQDLYSPVYLSRPVVPLAIAGAAAPRSYAGGVGGAPEAEAAHEEAAEAPRAAKMLMDRPAPAPSAASSGAARAPSRALDSDAAAIEASRARAAGDQFEFTLPRPVSLDRGRSALLALFAGEIRAARVSIYTQGQGRAALGARLANSTGMKLPAGPITVFDGGVYSGDALIDFFPESAERLISFGEDLDLTVEESAAASLETTGVAVSKGVMTFSRRRVLTKSYAFKNGASRDKAIIVEHPESSGAELQSPSSFLEKSGGRYRFGFEVPAGKDRVFAVVERQPVRETVTLASLGIDAFLRYASSGDIPEGVRAALSQAAELRRKWDEAARSVRDLGARRNELAADQGRIRSNLDALGRDTAEGKRYLKRLLDAEAELDKLAERLEQGRKAASAAQSEYESYLARLSL